MAPFHLPWSTFGAILLVIAAILLAVGWALWDIRHERKEEGK
jgi:hypothetical protein